MGKDRSKALHVIIIIETMVQFLTPLRETKYQIAKIQRIIGK